MDVYAVTRSLQLQSIIAIVLIGIVAGSLSSDESKFTEELLVRPLSSGHVYSHFEFTTTWSNPKIRKSIADYKDFGKFLCYVENIGHMLLVF